MIKKEETDSIFAIAKTMFLRYAKQQHEPIFNVAKRELENIENDIYFIRDDSNLRNKAGILGYL